jgi:hypothetical protein
MTSGLRVFWVLAFGLGACAARSRTDMHDVTKSNGELRTRGEVTFQVKPLAGPGSKGPHEIAPESEATLEDVRAMLQEHGDVRLRIECTVNPMTMGQLPDPAWAAQLAGMVARWLVDRGVDCKRLDARGFLGTDPGATAETVRFYVHGSAPERPEGASVDPCAKP